MTVALLAAVLYLAMARRAETSMRRRLEARLVERERASRELHDTLIQGLQGLILRFPGGLRAHSAARSFGCGSSWKKPWNEPIGCRSWIPGSPTPRRGLAAGTMTGMSPPIRVLTVDDHPSCGRHCCCHRGSGRHAAGR